MTVDPHRHTVALGAGILFTAGQVAVVLAGLRGDPSAVTTTALYRWSCVLLLAGFTGLIVAAFALHGGRAGRGGLLGTIGLLGAVTGTVLMAGDWWFETFAVPFYAEVAPQVLDIRGAGWLAAGGITSYLTFALGWALFGLACLRAGAVSRPAGVAMIVGGLVGYGAVLPPYGAVLGVAVAWAGLAWRDVGAGGRVRQPATR